MVGHAKNQINRIAHFRVVDYKILQLVSNVLLHKKIENVSLWDGMKNILRIIVSFNFIVHSKLQVI